MIKIVDVSKIYNVDSKKNRTMKQAVIDLISNNADDLPKDNKLKVINNLSLNIAAGECIGIIGENGAGKSTLLKMIARILYPDNGEIIVNGTVASLLEIGLGFNPELTGRENAYLYGALLGKRKSQMDRKINEIIEFSELGRFIDVQLKHYSTGMHMRLGFAVATSVDTDIILLDEVFSVGDAHFQHKSLERIYDFKRKGKTIVAVSHDTDLLREFCDRILYLDKSGENVIGGVHVIDDYLESVSREDE